MAKLVVLTEGFAGTAHELKGDKTTIGRLGDNAFQIPEQSVSGHHCEAMLHGEEVMIKDLNSTNGTYINGQPITEGTLKPGQVLRLGTIEVRLETEGGGAPAPVVAAGGRKHLDHTAPIPGGIKPADLEGSTRHIESPFEKKSDRTNKIFIYAGLALGAVIIGLIIFAIAML